MTIAKSFALYLQGLGIATLGQDLLIGRAPSSNETQDNIWWIIQSGGNPVRKYQTGEVMKSYSLLLYRRHKNSREIDESMDFLENQLNCQKCVDLEGFDAVDISASVFQTDDDLDAVDRKVGLLQVTITTYKECN